MDKYLEAIKILKERFGHDSLISIATSVNNIPSVRTVDSFYENGAFYTITYAMSNKIKQIEENPVVAVCGKWLTAHGIGENLGYICDEKNKEMADKLRNAFSAWYSEGHVNQADTNTIILKIRLTDAILFSNGEQFIIDFNNS